VLNSFEMQGRNSKNFEGIAVPITRNSDEDSSDEFSATFSLPARHTKFNLLNNICHIQLNTTKNLMNIEFVIMKNCII